ncbi:hypothetical protein [Neisseria meningitidis]|uniref:hypothetical protein n=1 Tax=Neisseria meningitidis TaxID=487 RepID=UPI0012991786|nr:hypothetical protein [Neisseria meningitidis]
MPSETANGIQTASSSTVIPAQAGIQISMPQEFIGKKSGNGNIQRLSESLRF